jgi:hypothetical protein
MGSGPRWMLGACARRWNLARGTGCPGPDSERTDRAVSFRGT